MKESCREFLFARADRELEKHRHLLTPLINPPLDAPGDGKGQKKERHRGLAHDVERQADEHEGVVGEADVQPRRHAVGDDCGRTTREAESA